jgi:hypothetical protein
MSYTNNPRSIIAGTGIVVTPTTGTGAETVTISANGLALEPLRIATVSPDTVTTSDAIVVYELALPGAIAVTLPAVPNVGQLFYLKDGTGDAATNPITITPVLGTIDGALTATINANYGALTITWNGTEWNIL